MSKKLHEADMQADQEAKINELANQVPEETEHSGDIAVLDDTAIAVMTDGEYRIKSLLDDLDEFLSTPFVQPTAMAQTGVPFTILKVGERQAEKIGSKPPVEITQLCYLVTLENGIQYLNKNKEEKTFEEGQTVVIALVDNKIRRTVWNKVKKTLDETDDVIPHMCLREFPPSAKAKAEGLGPSVGLCHESSWKSLY